MIDLDELKVVALEDDVHQRDVVEIIDRCIAAESKLAETEKHLKKWREDYENLVNSASESNVKFRDENISLRSKIAELDNQKPAYWMCDGYFVNHEKMVARLPDCMDVSIPLYLQPKPKLAEAVHIPETVKMFLDSIIDFCLDEDYLTEPASYVKTWLANKYLPNDTKPKESVDQRITEQDARAILESASLTLDHGDRSIDVEYWLGIEGRTLLAKLNEHRELDEKLNDGVAPYVYFKKIKGKDECSSWNEFSDGSSGGKPLFEKQVTANKAEVPSYIKIGEWNSEFLPANAVQFDGEIFRGSFPHGSPIFILPLPPLKDGAQ